MNGALTQNRPTTGAPDGYDAASQFYGMWEAIDVASPTPATWHVLVQPYAGANVPFQLTITRFQ